MEKTNCLVCAEAISTSKEYFTGEILSCGGCGQEHEVVQVASSFQLALAPELEEDWGE